MTELNQARRKFKVKLIGKQDTATPIAALMGRGDGTVSVPNQAGQVYIRVGNQENYGTAYNDRVPLTDNLPVFVGYDPVTDPDRRLFQVLTIRQSAYVDAGNPPIPQIGPHHTTHEFGGGDDVYLAWRRLMGLRVGRPALFVVTVDPGYIYRGATWIAAPVGASTVDLAAQQAALVGTQAQYVLISLDPTGAISVLPAGTIKASPALLLPGDIPTPPAGNIPLAAVKIYKTQTAIGDSPAAPEIIDLRFPTYGSMNNGGVAGLTTQVQYNDAGVFGADADFTWDKTTDTLYAEKATYDRADWLGGNVIYVPLDGDIQTYVNAAVAGDTLILASGEYVITATITVNKELNIMGQGNAGFYTIPYAAAHGTVISSATAAVTGFHITSSNVRIAHLSINLTGAASTGIETAPNLTGIVLTNIDVIVTCTGQAQGFMIEGSNAVFRDLTFYITSTNASCSGLYVFNTVATTQNAVVDCFSVTGVTKGTAGDSWCYICENNNCAKTITLNMSNSVCRALAGTALDVGVGVVSATTNNAIVNCYQCTLDGQDYDAYQAGDGGDNQLNIGGSVLVNNLVFGLVTYRAALAAGLGVFTGDVQAQTFTGTALTASTLIQASAGKVLTSIANAAGVLTNNGAGVFSWVAPGSTGWLLLGNAGTVAFTNFVGTTDDVALVFKTRGIVHGVLGSVAAGIVDGNARGVGAVDWQANRAGVGAATQVASGNYSVISGGYFNTASGATAAIGGGHENVASGDDSFVGGGFGNVASGDYSVICGGLGNTASGLYAMVAGGLNCVASGNKSWAGGLKADTNSKAGSFVWADDRDVLFTSIATGEAAFRVANGLRIAYDPDNYFTATVAATGVTTFATLPVGAGFVFTPPVTFSAALTANGGIVMADGATIGLGAGKGLIQFDDEATDFVSIMNCNVGIRTATPAGPLHVYNPSSFSLTDITDNIVLQSAANAGGIGTVGPSISFPNIAASAVSRRAAIACVQTTADSDQVGLAFFTHPASTSNNTIVEAMRIDHSGNVGIGTDAPAGKTTIDQSSTTAAIPVLELDQADVSEEMINFIVAATGAGDPVDTVTAVGAAYARLRVAVNGTFKYIQLYSA